MVETVYDSKGLIRYVLKQLYYHKNPDFIVPLSFNGISDLAPLIGVECHRY